QPLLVRGIDPGTGDDACAVAWTDSVLVEFDRCVDVGRVHHALLDEQRFKRFDAERDIRRDELARLPWLSGVGRLRSGGRGANAAAPNAARLRKPRRPTASGDFSAMDDSVRAPAYVRTGVQEKSHEVGDLRGSSFVFSRLSVSGRLDHLFRTYRLTR